MNAIKLLKKLMPKPRESGDQLEVALCILLDSLQLKCTTPEKRDKLYACYNNINQTNGINQITLRSAVSSILPNDPTHFYMTQDNDGTRGITSDIYVCNTTTSIGISCKRNNLSIKHQRPRALIQHLMLSKETELEYKTEYDKLIGNFYNTANTAKHILFNQVGESKHKLYSDINELACKYISAAADENKLHLIKFMLSANEKNSFILHYNDKKKSFKVCQLAKSIDTIESFNVTCVKTNYLEIECNTIKFVLRIHNASSRITKEVSVKYDTKLLDYDSVFAPIVPVVPQIPLIPVAPVVEILQQVPPVPIVPIVPMEPHAPQA